MSTPDDGPRVLAGRYQLHRLLGRGGAGEVWRGTDTRLGRPVAVKLVRIPPALDGRDQAETRRRVMREARAAARLDHPAAVTMFDVLEADGELCLVMELVEAPDLGRLVVDGGSLPDIEAARIGLDVLDALDAAHARGLVHRDVKPSNVLVPPDGPARLTDFGTAVIAGEDRLTATGMIYGSPAYMAPEQAVDVEVGPAADLWALGATLYQAVEGVPPFSGPTPVATMYSVMHDDPRPMQRGGGLQHVIDRLLIRDPAARAGAAEVRELLRAVSRSRTALLPAAAAGHRSPDAGRDADVAAGGEGVVPGPTSGGEAEGWASSPVSRRRGGGRSGMPVLLVAGVAVLLVGAAVLAWIAGQDGSTDSPAVTDATPATPTDAAQVIPPASTPTTVATPPPEETAPEPTPTPPPQDEEDADGDADEEQGNQGQGNQGQGNQGQGNQGQGDDDDDGDDDGPDDGAQPAVGALPAAPVPEDWVAYEPADAPYSLAHPPEWTIERLDATRTDISDPASATYLRLDWTDDPAPDPVADWEAYEPQFAEGREGYERLRMEPTTFKDEPAALWEYRYARGGVTYHAYNLNVSGGDYGYALNYQAREEDWAAMESLFSAFAQSYTIPG